MKLTRQEYEAMQKSRQGKSNESTGQNSRVGFFSLKNDGDEAVVRFAYNEIYEVFEDVVTCHPVTIDGKFKKVNCLRSPKGPIEDCPLCANGERYEQRVYIRLIEYIRGEDGSITPVAKVWDRPRSYVDLLNNFYTEYGDISGQVFKIKRSGAAGSKDTKYNIIPANPTIYNSNIYVADFSAFDGYNPVRTAVVDMSYDDLATLHQGTTTNSGTTVEPDQSAEAMTHRAGNSPESPTVRRVIYK